MPYKLDVVEIEEYAATYTLTGMIAKYQYLVNQYNKLVTDYDKIEEHLFDVQCQLENERQSRQESLMYRDSPTFGW
jgi:hypothetical protein